MYIEVNLRAVPAAMTLHEPEDFTSFKVVIDAPAETFVELGTLEALAGARADDPAWRDGLDKMLQYARQKGWTNGAGGIRAHIERA